MRSRTMVGGAVVLAALGAIASVATSADAYPPGSKLSAAVLNISADPDGTYSVLLRVSNAAPRCSASAAVKKIVYGSTDTPPVVAPDKNVSFNLQATKLPQPKDSTSTIVVTTTCPSSRTEKTKTKVLLRRAQIDVDEECRVGRSCQLRPEHFLPDAKVNYLATRAGGGAADIEGTKRANGDGAMKLQLTFPKDGTWTVTAWSGTTVASVTLTVKKK